MIPPNELDGTADGRTDVISAVATFRAATRQLLRNQELEADLRQRALMWLLRKARAGGSAEWAIRAIQEEVEFSVDAQFFALEHGWQLREGGDVVERRALQLRHEGRIRCPRCLRHLLTEDDVARASALRQAEVERLAVRERAVP
jgi:hypothetical protein